MLKNYLELLKKGLESFSHLGKNGSWIDYLSTIKYEFLILLIGIGIIIGAFLICIGPYFYNKFANKKANKLSGKNIADLVLKKLINFVHYLGDLNYNLIINDKDFFNPQKIDFERNIKYATEKEMDAIINAISKFQTKLLQNHYYDLTISSNLSCVNNLLQTYNNGDNKNINDLLIDTIKQLYQLRIDCINMRDHNAEDVLKKFTTAEEFSKITKQMNKINDLASTKEISLINCVDNIFNKKYYVCKIALLLAFYIPYIMVVVPLLMMLF